MPPPNRPRRPANDEPVPYDQAQDLGWEVVEDQPAVPRKAAPKVAPSAPPPAPKLAPKIAAKPVRAVVADDTIENDEPRPKPKKAKKKRRALTDDELDEERRAKALAHFEWVAPSVILVIGLVMTFVGALGVGGKDAAFHTLGVMVIGLFVTIPATVGALMVVGMVMGIEYGRFGPAILKIAAITFLANGVMFLGDWFKLPGFLVFPVSCAISFGLFLTQFDLDTWEANISVTGVNVMTFLANIVLVGFLVVAAANADRGGPGFNDDPDPDDNPPADTRPGKRWKKGDQPPAPDPDDDPDPDE